MESIFKDVIQPTYEAHRKSLAGASEEEVEEVSGASAEVLDLAKGLVGIRVYCFEAPSDRVYEMEEAPATLVQVLVPGPCGMDDAEMVTLTFADGVLSVTLDSDDYPWLFTPEILTERAYVTLYLQRVSLSSGTSSTEHEVHVLVGMAEEEIKRMDETEPENWEASDDGEWLDNKKMRYHDATQRLLEKGGDQSWQKRRRRGKRAGRRVCNVAKRVWLEEKMSELTERMARCQLELEATKPTLQKGSRSQKKNGGYWHAEERSRGHGGRCQKRWLGEHSSKARC